MKRIYLFIAVLCITTPVFALPDFTLSVGGGGIFNTHWKQGFLRDEFKDYRGGELRDGVSIPTDATRDAMRQGLFDTREFVAGGGIYAFFDATFAELGVGLVFNNVRQTVAIPNMPDISPTLTGEETYNYLFKQINLSLLLKYPFPIGQSGWTLFPLVGIDGQIAIGDYDDNMRRDFQQVANMGYDMPTIGEFWNALWIRFGIGADYKLTERLFIRGQALYGFKLNSQYENDMASYWKEDIRGVSNGLNIRLGVGYQLTNLSAR